MDEYVRALTKVLLNSWKRRHPFGFFRRIIIFFLW